MILHNQPTFSNKQELKSFIDMVVREEFNNDQIDNEILIDLISHKNSILEDFNNNNSVSNITFFSHLFLPIASYKNLFNRNDEQRLKALNNCASAVEVSINKIYDNVLALLLMSKYGLCTNSDGMINIFQRVYTEIISLLCYKSFRHFTIADNANFLANFDDDIVIMLNDLNTQLFQRCHALELQENLS